MLVLAGGAALVLAFGAIWHGPVGKGERFASQTERFTRKVLVDWEMAPVTAVVPRNPISGRSFPALFAWPTVRFARS